MSYRADVKVMVLSRDDTTGKNIVVERRDMAYTVLIREPGEGVQAAKAAFAKKHGPDLLCRTASLQDRKTILLYCQPKVQHPANAGARDLPFAKHLPQSRR